VGNVFNGTFVRNQKNGCATYKDIEETTEQGLWKHNIKQGLFKIIYSNGSQFCVNYVDGHMNGAPSGGKCTECPTLEEKKACVCL
jgi:antitoxin component YwqK of YwqJK toxin-antitoxin module